MNKLFLIVAALGVFYFFNGNEESAEVLRLAGHDEVIMYSLTTCGYCKAKGKELRQAGIAYSEYYIDRDSQRMNELNEKLQQSGLPPKRYGTPILDVKGYMMPNNPSMNKIKERLASVN